MGAGVAAGSIQTLNYWAGPRLPVPSPPAQIPATKSGFVDRPDLTEPLAAALATSPLVGLYGTGGFGKTALAARICADLSGQFDGGTLWVTLGERAIGPELAARINDLIVRLTGEAAILTQADQAGFRLGEVLGVHPGRLLLVVDDVWHDEQIRAFPTTQHTILVTTRSPDVLPADAAAIRVDQMSRAQAETLLGHDLPGQLGSAADALLQLTGRWPLLVTLCNRWLVRAHRQGATPPEAAEHLRRRLVRTGPASLDVQSRSSRDRAVATSLEASIELLRPADRKRLRELSIFAENLDIDLSALGLLWPGRNAERLCEELSSLSLLADQGLETVRLHDVVRTYLRSTLDASDLIAAHRRLLDNAARLATDWWLLPPEQGFIRRQLVHHLIEAGRTGEAMSLVEDLCWSLRRLRDDSPAALEADLAAVDTPVAAALRKAIARGAPLLTPMDPPAALGAVLVDRLIGIEVLVPAVTRFVTTLRGSWLVRRWPPDPPHAALVRSFAEARERVDDVMIIPEQRRLVSVDSRGRLRFWDIDTGTTYAEHALAHAGIPALAATATMVAAAAGDGTVHLFDVVGRPLRSFPVSRGGMQTLALSPDESWLAVAGANDGIIRIRDAGTGELRREIRCHQGSVAGIAIAGDGVTMVTVGAGDGMIKLIDSHTGKTRAAYPSGHFQVQAMALGPDDAWVVTAGYYDGLVRITDLRDGRLIRHLPPQPFAVNALAVSPDGATLVTASKAGTVSVWRMADGQRCDELAEHTGSVTAVAIADSGAWLATADESGAVRIWDVAAALAEGEIPRQSLARDVFSIAAAGEWIAVAGEDNAIRIVDHRTGTERGLGACNAPASDLTIAPDGTWLMFVDGTRPRVLIRYAVPDGTRLSAPGLMLTKVRLLRAAPDGSWVAMVEGRGDDQTIRLWNVAAAEFTGAIPIDGYVRDLAIGPDGTLWAATSDYVQIAGEPVRLEGVARGLRGVAVAPDGSWLATAGADRKLVVWDLPGRRERQILELPEGQVAEMAVAPDGRWLAIAMIQGTIQVWATTEVAWRTAAAIRVDETPFACAWLPDSTGLAIGGSSGRTVFDLRHQ